MSVLSGLNLEKMKGLSFPGCNNHMTVLSGCPSSGFDGTSKTRKKEPEFPQVSLNRFLHVG